MCFHFHRLQEDDGEEKGEIRRFIKRSAFCGKMTRARLNLRDGTSDGASCFSWHRNSVLCCQRKWFILLQSQKKKKYKKNHKAPTSTQMHAKKDDCWILNELKIFWIFRFDDGMQSADRYDGADVRTDASMMQRSRVYGTHPFTHTSSRTRSKAKREGEGAYYECDYERVYFSHFRSRVFFIIALRQLRQKPKKINFNDLSGTETLPFALSSYGMRYLMNEKCWRSLCECLSLLSLSFNLPINRTILSPSLSLEISFFVQTSFPQSIYFDFASRLHSHKHNWTHSPI